MDDVRKHLREAAEAHQPGRDAMLARIRQGMVSSADADRARSYRRRRQALWLKVWIAGVVGAGGWSLGGLALAAEVRQSAPQHSPNDVTPTGTTAGGPQTPRSSATRPAAPIPGGPGAPTSRHSATPSADGPITARGDVNAKSTVYWEQNDLTVDAAQPLTALTVELRIAQSSSGVQSTGTWQTVPTDDFTITVTPADGFLVYRWALKPGRTLPASRQVFAAQFNQGAGKRDASKDTFLVETTEAGRTVAVRGGFGNGS